MTLALSATASGLIRLPLGILRCFMIGRRFWPQLASEKRGALIAVTLAFVVFLAVAYFAVIKSGFADPLYKETFDRMSEVQNEIKPGRWEPNELFTRIYVLNVLTAVFVVSLAFALSTLLAAPVPNRDLVLDQRRRSQELLYLAAALLVTSVLQVKALYEWPASAVPHSLATPMMTMAGLVAMIYGVFFSLVLLALFAPAIHLVERRVAGMGIVEERTHPGRPSDGSTAGGMQRNSSTVETALNVLAVLAPLLAALIGNPLSQGGG